MHSRAASIFWFLVGLYTMVGGIQLGVGSPRQPGPGFIFLLAAALLVFLSLIDLGVTFSQKARSRQGGELLWSGFRWQKVLLVLLGISAYVFLFNILGFFVGSLLLMVFLFKAVEPTRWRTALIGSLSTILVAYAIFKIWLKVPFPTGILG